MTVIDYFKQLTQIPHCSHRAEAMKNFLIAFAKKHHYDVSTDKTGNILVSRGKPQLCLQAHYDMVCVGRAPEIETVTEEGWIYAKDSSLGADNAIAVAMMLSLIAEGYGCEYLFTADEEVGLIGANALTFPLQSRYMLNLDSEDEAEVYIGCAGGVDIFAQKRYARHACEKPFYEIIVSGLPGGHSGVEIHKDIPNAIKYFAAYCQERDVEIASIEGGERINSIPTSLHALVASDVPLEGSVWINVKKIEKSYSVIDGSAELINILHQSPHGVLAWNEALEIPDRSINLATVSLKDGVCTVALSARAMDSDGLEHVEKETTRFFTSYGYSVKSEGKYPAWKPQINDFSKMVCAKMQKQFSRCTYKAIHAGLECAVISSRYPHIEIASIGPNIRSPHSTHEKVEVASVERVYGVVKEIVHELS